MTQHLATHIIGSGVYIFAQRHEVGVCYRILNFKFLIGLALQR